MRRLVWPVLAALLAAAMALTNPTVEDYQAFLKTVLRVQGEALAGGGLGGVMADVVAEQVATQHTTRRDYGLFSVFVSDYAGQRWLWVGAFKRVFLPLSVPRPAPSGSQPGSPAPAPQGSSGS